MNVYIYNCSNTFNYGSMMMGENFISYFDNISGVKNKYYVETLNEVNIRRLKKATQVSEIYPVKMNALFNENIGKSDLIYGYFGMKNVSSDLIKRIDLVVVLGGDDFTEDYGWKPPIRNTLKFNILKRKGLKVVMLGQTMGPYKSFRKPIMKYLLNKIDKIYPRDPITYKYLSNMGLKNLNLTDDLALLPLTLQKNIEKQEKYITYCPSELIYRYSKEGNRQDWINFNLFMINKIIEKYPDKKLVLLAHVLENVDDRLILNELYDNIDEDYKERIILKNEEIYPFEVREYLSQSYLTFSSRMHPVISSIQCKTPAIAISYSTKYWGIIGERYDLKDYIIDIRYLDYDEMKKRFVELLDKIEINHGEIKTKMEEKNKLAEKSIMKAFKEIVSIF